MYPSIDQSFKLNSQAFFIVRTPNSLRTKLSEKSVAVSAEKAQNQGPVKTEVGCLGSHIWFQAAQTRLCLRRGCCRMTWEGQKEFLLGAQGQQSLKSLLHIGFPSYQLESISRLLIFFQLTSEESVLWQGSQRSSNVYIMT